MLPLQVDPLALVHAIERYLITRGYGAASSDEKGSSDKRDIFMLMDDDDSEDEIEVDDDDDDDDDVHPVTTSNFLRLFLLVPIVKNFTFIVQRQMICFKVKLVFIAIHNLVKFCF